jgi:hypothetical protein
MAGKAKIDTTTLEMVIERLEALDARFDKMEISFNRKSEEQLDQATKREATIEEWILGSVNDQADATMARVNATSY